MISWAKPGPSSRMTSDHVVPSTSATRSSTRVVGEIDGVFQQVAEPIGDGRVAREDTARRMPLAGASRPDGRRRSRHREPRSGATISSIITDSLRRANMSSVCARGWRAARGFRGSARLADQEIDILRMRTRRSGIPRFSSLATSAMVASGVPSSWAAAAASPSSAESCCSRASTISVAASAVRHLPRFLGDAARIERREHARRTRSPPTCRRYRAAAAPAGAAPSRAAAGGRWRGRSRSASASPPSHSVHLRRQGRRRHRHRHEEQEGERIFEPAGEIEQHRQLHDVVAEKQAVACARASRTLDRQRRVRKILSQADSAMTARHQPSGSGKPRPEGTTSTAPVWPNTASQRRRTRVCSRSRLAGGIGFRHGRSSAAPPSRREWSEWLERLTITALRRLDAAASAFKTAAIFATLRPCPPPGRCSLPHACRSPR